MHLSSCKWKSSICKGTSSINLPCFKCLSC